MDFRYNGEHTVEFICPNQNFLSWGPDWHLIPAGKPVIAPPELIENYVDIPGANGRLDLTETLTGYPLYQMRTGDLTFVVVPDSRDVIHPWSWEWSGWTLEKAYADIAREIHGRKIQLILADEDEKEKVDNDWITTRCWMYTGRVTLGDLQAAKEYNMLTMHYALEPFRTAYYPQQQDSGSVDLSNNWIVNENYQVDHTAIQSGQTAMLSIDIDRWPGRIIPELRVSRGGITATIENSDSGAGISATLTPGVYKYPAIQLAPGGNMLYFRNDGENPVRVDVRYAEVSL